MLQAIRCFVLAACLAGIAPTAGAVDDYGVSMSKQPVHTNEASSSAQAQESYGSAVANKVGSGFSNVALSFLEIPKNVINTTNETNLALGITGGVAKGLLHMAGRFLAGTVDLVTFPMPTASLTTPQYVWSNYTVETRYGSAFKVKETKE